MLLPAGVSLAAETAGQADDVTVTATWPDGVTTQDVYDYIHDPNNFSQDQFADAVWKAIATSGQDFSRLYRSLENNRLIQLKNAADVIKYYGGDITVDRQFHQPLKGLTLLNSAMTLYLQNMSNWDDLSFDESVYDYSDPDPYDFSDPQPVSNKGPRFVVNNDAAVELHRLPARPYTSNLTRVSTGMNDFQAPTYNSTDISLLRDMSDSVKIDIDTRMETHDGSPVDLANPYANPQRYGAGNIGQNAPTSTSANWPGKNSNGDKSSVTAKGNHIYVNIDSCAPDGNYEYRSNYERLYNYAADQVYQKNSINFAYGVISTWLSTVNLTGTPTVLSGLKVVKTADNGSGKTLAGAVFELKDANDNPAKQYKVDENGSLVASEVGQVTTGNDGTLTISGLKPGTYTLHEVRAPAGYQLAADQQVIVGSGMQNPSMVVTGGEGTTTQVLTKDAHFTTHYGGKYTNWASAAEMTPTDASGNVISAADQLDTVQASDHGGQVFIQNYGNSINVNANGVDADATVSSGEYTVNNQSFDSLKKAVDYVNTTLIRKNGLTCADPVVTIDASKAVYEDSSTYTTVNVTDASHKPVNVSLEAQKHFTDSNGNDQAIADGRFAFALTPENANAKLLSSNALNASVGADGKATWNLPSITADAFSKATKNDKGVASFNFTASEVAGKDTDVQYDKTKIPVRLDVSEAKNGTDEGLKVEVFVNNKSVGSATSGKDPATLKVSAKDSGLAFTNTVVPQVVKGSFSFAKRDGDETSKALAGATFRLFECKAGAGKCGTGTSADDVIDPDDPGSDWTRVGSDVTSGGDGLVTFDDLARPGEYRLVEVASPAGYAKPAGQWRVTYSDKDAVEPRIESVGEAPAFFTVSRSLAAGASVSPASVRAGNSMLAVPNYKTIAVPSTGGRGWLISSLAGFGLLLAGVTVLSVESRRRCR
ncbi:SpaA isopeptide-forming pilin-related protein [Bifidobacterium cebidarum]|nr:SpaA isopeptide-forming pilin-related protein [Bifidobacterium cebidarum]